MKNTKFVKMHGCGNDFVIIDDRKDETHLSPENIRLISDRYLGIGCDQLIVIKPSSKADCLIKIYNADGSEAGACGNATRCVASIIMQENQQDSMSIETITRILPVRRAGDLFEVNMGMPRLNWQEIPVSREMDIENINMGLESLPVGIAVNMGNPHIVFFVKRVDYLDIVRLGPRIENDSLFPERVNVNFAEILDDQTIKLRVWERGTGETMACGSGACATFVAASRKGLIGKKAKTLLKGGELNVAWSEDNNILMIGPAVKVFEGSFSI
jgi:diaminopimelate epimerase